MISFETDDSWAIGATFDVGGAPGAFNVVSATSAVGVMLEWLAWANDGARPWFGAIVFSWRAQRHVTNSGIQFIIDATANFSITGVTANWVARMGLDVGGPWATQTGNSASGTVAPLRWALRSADPTPLGAIDIGGAGSVFGQRPSTAAIRPIVEAAETQVDNARRESLLFHCTNPRAAYLSDQNYNTAPTIATQTGWNRYQIGKIAPTRRTGIRWHTTIEATR